MIGPNFMRSWIHDKASVIFGTILGVYGVIWVTVSYIGVYVTYIVGPIVVISGITAWFTASNEET